MTELYHLAYISKAKIPGDLDTVKQEVNDILTAAQRNNPRLEITGALLYSGGYFCQVIEGEMEHLEELFEIIQLDGRHNEVTVLHFEPLENRGFSDWSMAFAGIEDRMRFDIAGIKASKDDLPAKQAGKELVSTLEALVSQHQSLATSLP